MVSFFTNAFVATYEIVNEAVAVQKINLPLVSEKNPLHTE